MINKQTQLVRGLRANFGASHRLALTLTALIGLTLAAQMQSRAASAASVANSAASSDDKGKSSEGNGAGASASSGSSAASAGKVSPVQSTARPFGLNIVAPVMQAGSDGKSQSFQSSVLPSALKFINSALPEYKDNSKNSSVMSLDLSRLKLQTDYSVRAYFVGEGAGYANTLGFNTTGIGAKTGNPELIFPNASSSVGALPSGQTGVRSQGEPLLPGDFVNLGKTERGTLLNFFLIANGANGGQSVFTTAGASSNPDGINHVASFTPHLFAVPHLNSPYLFLSFEDMNGGGDKDYNDTIFALDVGKATVNYLLGTPEPSLCLTLGGFLGLAVWGKRRMDRGQIKTAAFPA